MPRASRTDWLLVATILILFAACALRITVSFQPLWLDEIWSLMFADRMEHWWQVFTIHHLNNHPLNTLYLWVLGRGQWSIFYRIPALLSGIALLLWMTRDAWRRSHQEGFFTALFIGFALPVVQASTEARGYGPMLLAAYAAYVFFRRMEHSGQKRDIAFYILAASAAVVLHLSAITVILAAATSTLVRCYGKGIVEASRVTLRRHAVPFMVFGLLVVFTLNHQAFDGGQDPGVSFGTFGANVLGWPGLSPVIAMGLSLVALIALIAVIEYRIRKDPPEGVFLLVLLFLAPALLIFAGSRAIGLEVRFFLPGVATFYLFLSKSCAKAIAHRSYHVKGAVLIVVLLVTTGHVQSDARLLREGRGKSRSFPEVITYMREHSSSRPVTYGTQFSIDNVLVEHFGNTPGLEPEFVFIRPDTWETYPPEWLLERQYAWENVREDFLERASKDYAIVLPFQEERWWMVWKRKIP
ncbi:hypothetical protein A3F36_03155 [Candidatus Peribacteria bacterium RIFCSPHIGHO2_12_FULL_55_11]|nr:MAG: hypothetical protein A3F36_03155 [Candidatus Peribacteria bacterium RIFCSPHIGHO2_12_FULL_55_11]